MPAVAAAVVLRNGYRRLSGHTTPAGTGLHSPESGLLCATLNLSYQGGGTWKGSAGIASAGVSADANLARP